MNGRDKVKLIKSMIKQYVLNGNLLLNLIDDDGDYKIVRKDKQKMSREEMLNFNSLRFGMGLAWSALEDMIDNEEDK